MTDDANANVSAVSIKIPPFWANDPNLWFAQVEAQFAAKSISTSLTKYNYIVSYLTPDIASEVRDIIALPTENPYQKLKDAILARTSQSERQRLQKLISLEQLGDRKPSQLLRSMQQLLGDTNFDKDLFLQLFLQRLPPQAQQVLAGCSQDMDINKVASMADRILDIPAMSYQPTPPSISTINHPKSTDMELIMSQMTEMNIQLSQLTREVTQLKQKSQRHPSYRRSFSRSSDRRRRSVSPRNKDTCWYHTKFGSKATKCTSPCTYSLSTQDFNKG